MGLMLSRLWLLRRGTLADRSSQESQCLVGSCEEEGAEEECISSSTNGFSLQVPSEGGSPIQKLPQDLFLK